MRLDNYLTKKGYFETRTKSKQAIERGEIFLDGKLINKPSFFVDENKSLNIERIFEKEFVSIGGFKLDKALIDFNYSVNNKICADIGCSTGGFTDCLLKNGAKKVYSVDLNENLLHDSLKENEKVSFIMKNARYLNKDDFQDDIDLITADLSFIPLELILPVMSNIINDRKDLILLIKPQFESDRKISFKNGIVKDKNLRYKSCKNVIDCGINYRLFPQKITLAPISKDKNVEYLIFLKKNCKIDFNLDTFFAKSN